MFLFYFHSNSQNGVNDKCTAIPRPITKRQFSSPANCGVAHINLSDVVAKINNGPKSCTNPFLNGSLSISEDDNSNSIAINEMAHNQYNSKQLHTHIIDTKLQKNPFNNRQRHDDTTFFSFPSNGNIDENQATNIDVKHASNILIELNDEVTLADVNGPTLSHNTPSSNTCSHGVHNRSLSDNGTTLLNGDIYDEQSTTNPFNTLNLHKTVSDTHLEQYSMQKQSFTYSVDHHRTFSRQSITTACSEQVYQSSVPSSIPLNLNEGEIKRAMSCDSVNSESSVLLGDLEQQKMPTITGQLCVGLQYDK